MRRYQHVLSLLPGEQIDQLFHDGLLGPNSADGMPECWASMADLMSATDELGGLQFLEVRSTLPDELLMYADKLSMAHGLELRVPFVDKEIVEYVERLPANLKVRNGSRKWLHRQVCQTYLSGSILERPKRGFANNVVDDWFRSAFDGRMADIFLDGNSGIYQYLRADAVSKLFELHSSGRRDNHKILFSLVVFEEWLRVQESPVAVLS
jgi:asparagine synthase (glutamine-hydrolysing)